MFGFATCMFSDDSSQRRVKPIDTIFIVEKNSTHWIRPIAGNNVNESTCNFAFTFAFIFIPVSRYVRRHSVRSIVDFRIFYCAVRTNAPTCFAKLPPKYVFHPVHDFSRNRRQLSHHRRQRRTISSIVFPRKVFIRSGVCTLLMRWLIATVFKRPVLPPRIAKYSRVVCARGGYFAKNHLTALRGRSRACIYV